MWYAAYSSSGTQTFNLYPPPSTSGDAIELTYVYMPTALSAGTDTPSWLPEEFHTALLHYAKAEAFGALEDNTENESFYNDRFDLAVAELKRHRIRLANQAGPVQIRVAGVTA